MVFENGIRTRIVGVAPAAQRDDRRRRTSATPSLVVMATRRSMRTAYSAGRASSSPGEQRRRKLIADPAARRRRMTRSHATDPARRARIGSTRRHGRRREPAVPGAEHQHESGEHPVKEDRNRSARPALGRIERHANRVADHHDAEVHGSDGEEGGADRPPRRGEEAAATRQVERDPAAHDDDEHLAGEERRDTRARPRTTLPMAAGSRRHPTAISS